MELKKIEGTGREKANVNQRRKIGNEGK